MVNMTGLKGNYQIALDISIAEITAIAHSQARSMAIDVQPVPRQNSICAHNGTDV